MAKQQSFADKANKLGKKNELIVKKHFRKRRSWFKTFMSENASIFQKPDLNVHTELIQDQSFATSEQVNCSFQQYTRLGVLLKFLSSRQRSPFGSTSLNS